MMYFNFKISEKYIHDYSTLMGAIALFSEDYKLINVQESRVNYVVEGTESYWNFVLYDVEKIGCAIKWLSQMEIEYDVKCVK